ncbi:hypothetical protein TSTA_091730 [Talaromyces stipitatus ATCC 10500]|uniref:Uncharacterized protein n=1 Tax=Talaromyces stipitatus (strain ATCC 10500 / CBS 375.48 / QM 6759 / NRRL 1006) TaxID=441959 RepID=B8M2M1_TALSN|nr:uncharacterized protein TSTA_091730 [Talaromyces stipitatus ATCC 10500]EED21932.1 hypothetical protein TSTA_091730 [Talaromyces stipitatus ATCC 10500]
MEPELTTDPDDRIDQVAQYITILGNKIGQLEQKVKNVEGKLTTIDQNLAHIDKRIEDMSKDVVERDDQLDTQDSLWLNVRAGELDNVWDQVTNGHEEDDIFITHGADVELDMRVLNHLHNTDEARLETAEIGFEHLYGYKFDGDNEEMIMGSPQEVRSIINMRANLKFLRAWKANSTMTDYLIDRWGNRENVYYPKSRLKQEYLELLNSYKQKGED